MNVLTILRSVEELLYEVMSWLLFYPLTFWRTLHSPIKTMRYSDAEQHDKTEKQYLETLSPPLFLVLSIVLAHGVEIVLGIKFTGDSTTLGRLVTENDQTLLGFRALVFSLPALLFAWISLRLKHRLVDRESLRAPFFAQCYLSGATAILVSVGFGGVRYPGLASTVAGAVVIVLATIWYLWVQWRWIKQETGLGQPRVTLITAGTFLASMMLISGTAVLISI